jgi:hypothetical protein
MRANGLAGHDGLVADVIGDIGGIDGAAALVRQGEQS